MDQNLVYLFIAFLALWGGVGAYLWRLASLRHRLEERVGRLESACAPEGRKGG